MSLGFQNFTKLGAAVQTFSAFFCSTPTSQSSHLSDNHIKGTFFPHLVDVLCDVTLHKV